MNIELKELRTLELEDSFKNYWPTDPVNFGCWIRTMIGPNDQDGAEAFDILVCTPVWLQNELVSNKALSDKGMIIVEEYDYDEILSYVEKKVITCNDSYWSKTAIKLSHFSLWEYEDYQT